MSRRGRSLCEGATIDGATELCLGIIFPTPYPQGYGDTPLLPRRHRGMRGVPGEHARGRRGSQRRMARTPGDGRVRGRVRRRAETYEGTAHGRRRAGRATWGVVSDRTAGRLVDHGSPVVDAVTPVTTATPATRELTCPYDRITAPSPRPPRHRSPPPAGPAGPARRVRRARRGRRPRPPAPSRLSRLPTPRVMWFAGRRSVAYSYRWCSSCSAPPSAEPPYPRSDLSP